MVYDNIFIASKQVKQNIHGSQLTGVLPHSPHCKSRHGPDWDCGSKARMLMNGDALGSTLSKFIMKMSKTIMYESI